MQPLLNAAGLTHLSAVVMRVGFYLELASNAATVAGFTIAHLGIARIHIWILDKIEITASWTRPD